jgi:DNA-binding CsgD family transcriptional regulator
MATPRSPGAASSDHVALHRRIDELERRIERLERLAAPVNTGASLLTPRQRRIAALVATGLTNAETAEMLSVAAKTVEWNLSRIYRVLGVRSRTELTIRLRAQA